MTLKQRPLCEQGMGRMIDALSGYGLQRFLPLVRRRLLSISVEKDKTALVFRFSDGEVRYIADGDCCSQSWIEHMEAPEDLEGAEIVGVEELPVIDATEDDTQNPRREPSEWDQEPDRVHECLQLYQTVFRTTKGDVTVEYRNSSNGYYGGSLELQPFPCPKCGEQIGKYEVDEHISCWEKP